MVTVQRLIELRGIPTVCITVAPDETAQAHPPRALCPRGFGPGHSLGRPDSDFQRRIVLDALELLRTAKEPGRIVSRDYPG